MLRQDTVDGAVTIGHNRQDSYLHYDTVDTVDLNMLEHSS